jgi:DNA polymerase-3 subunit epsilon
MFKTLQRWRNRRNLKLENYAFLFAEPPDNELICFDCETTSLNPKTADILSIGAVKIKGNLIETSQKLELFIKLFCQCVSPKVVRINLLTFLTPQINDDLI